MVHDLLRLIPDIPADLRDVVLGSLLIGTAAGAVLWLIGSRISRSLVTLALVGLGAVLGLHLPRWFNWPVEGPVIAIGGAIVLGVIGFRFHRVFVGVGLGWLLAAWATPACWILWPVSQWTWPTFDPAKPPAYVQQIWANLPAEFTRTVPIAAGVAFAAGLVLCLLWARLGVILFHTLLGVTLMVGMGLTAMQIAHPEWIAGIPTQGTVQGSILGALVLIGLVVQWKLSPKRKVSGAADKDAAPKPPKDKPQGQGKSEKK